MYYPYGPGVVPEDEESPKPKTQGGIFACIYSAHGHTFCGRQPSSKEFTFSREGCEKVIDYYDPRAWPKTPTPRLAGCVDCIDKAKEVIEKEGIPRIA